MSFLDDKEDKNTSQEESVDKIKVGDMEFAPDELQDIVGKYKDWDEKTKAHGGVEHLVSDYGRRAAKVGELEQQVNELSRKLEEKERPVQDSGQPSPEEILKAATDQGFVTKANFNDMISQYRQAEKLADEAKELEAKGNPYGDESLPKFDALDMLQYMSETGIKNPVKAYKDRYEKEIDAWKEKELTKGRPKGMVTEESSSPGNKQPKQVKITRENLEDMLHASLNREI